MNNFGVFMSYCRQEGTKKAIEEALNQVEEYKDDPDMDMSDSEVKAFKAYIQQIHNWMNDMNLIGYEGELNHDELNSLCLNLKGEWYKGDE